MTTTHNRQYQPVETKSVFDILMENLWPKPRPQKVDSKELMIPSEITEADDYYWHFVQMDRHSNSLRLGYNDNRTVMAGYKYKVRGQIDVCHYGLHACKKLFHAASIRLESGDSHLCLVRLVGKQLHSDTYGCKFASNERIVVKIISVSQLMDVVHRYTITENVRAGYTLEDDIFLTYYRELYKSWKGNSVSFYHTKKFHYIQMDWLKDVLSKHNYELEKAVLDYMLHQTY